MDLFILPVLMESFLFSICMQVKVKLTLLLIKFPLKKKTLYIYVNSVF